MPAREINKSKDAEATLRCQGPVIDLNNDDDDPVIGLDNDDDNAVIDLAHDVEDSAPLLGE